MHGLRAGGSFTIVSAPIQHEIVPGKRAPMLAYTVEHNRRTSGSVSSNRHRQFASSALLERTRRNQHRSLARTQGRHQQRRGPSVRGERRRDYDYQFTVANRRTYWYHPHPHHLAGKQAYLGLAGFLLVEDADELALQRTLDLTFGSTDIPLLVQDKRLHKDGSLTYASGGTEHFHGHLGEHILVNLTPSPCLDCESRLYRFAS